MQAFSERVLEIAAWENLAQIASPGPVVIAGYLTERCVLSTYRGAIERGFKPTLLADGVAGVQHPEAVLAWCDHITSEQILTANAG